MAESEWGARSGESSGDIRKMICGKRRKKERVEAGPRKGVERGGAHENDFRKEKEGRKRGWRQGREKG